jgi:hypothetical protein
MLSVSLKLSGGADHRIGAMKSSYDERRVVDLAEEPTRGSSEVDDPSELHLSSFEPRIQLNVHLYSSSVPSASALSPPASRDCPKRPSSSRTSLHLQLLTDPRTPLHLAYTSPSHDCIAPPPCDSATPVASLARAPQKKVKTLTRTHPPPLSLDPPFLTLPIFHEPQQTGLVRSDVLARFTIPVRRGEGGGGEGEAWAEVQGWRSAGA